MNKKIIFTTGGTGGHILPAFNLMKHFFDKGYQVLLVTDFRGKKFLESYPELDFRVIKTGTPTSKNIFKKFSSLFLIFYAMIISINILKKEKPNLIFGFGGYVSFPICFVAKLFNLPTVLYENNVVLGRANKYLLPFAKKILVAKKIIKNFPKKYLNKFCQVGSILNKNITNYTLKKENSGKKNFSILVLGGSQGAEIFGKVIPEVIKMIKEQGHEIEINQQCIEQQKNHLFNFYKKHNIKNNIFIFKEDIINLISNTNLAITRCGASTTAELSHTQTPFIAVPLPNSIDNHQFLNAKYYEEKGYCWILELNNFTSENLFNLVIKIIKNRKKLEDVRENMRKDYSKNTYSNIENEIKGFI